MKLLLENWRQYLKEDVVDLTSRRAPADEKEFIFDETKRKQLNKSIAVIVSRAKKVLGGEGEIPFFSTEDLEEVELAEPIKMVAEADYLEDEDLEGLGVTPFQAAQASPEQMALRRQYYGPEGELAKRGPKAVKDLEKGLGRMSAQEFEEAGYVLRVSQDVLNDFKFLVESAEEVEGLYEEARDWYHNIRGLLDQETDSDRDATLLGLMIATYSPRAKFALNLVEAVFMYKAVKEDIEKNPQRLEEYLETFAGAEKRQPGESRGFTGAHKVPNFALNLIAPHLAGERDEHGNINYNDLYDWNSTIDTWMIDAFYPSLRKASTAKEWEAIKGKLMSTTTSYRHMANLVAQEAKKLKILPHELQALIWVSSQIRQTGEAGLGVTTQFAFDQIRQAITNVEKIKVELKDDKELGKETGEGEQESWLAKILSTIDNEGFEEAARYALEKGMGVRSITSRGKKGEMFGYFPSPERIEKPKGPKQAKKEKAMKPYEDPQFENLNTHYVMNSVIQMPAGKFNNLYDSIMLYLDPEFSTEKAVEYITGRFDPEARSTKSYFKEGLIRIRIAKRK